MVLLMYRNGIWVYDSTLGSDEHSIHRHTKEVWFIFELANQIEMDLKRVAFTNFLQCT